MVICNNVCVHLPTLWSLAMLSPDVQEVLQRQCLEALAELGILQFDPLTEKMISWPWYVTGVATYDPSS